ncbi:MAG: hypothetical protein IT288_10960 [Bdellovibrionales bacterium]|nr:hypothetical protein [Bdellovibrionales bacterium]
MWKQDQDLLYVCFEKNLHEYLVEDESVEEFSSRVIQDFATRLVSKGHIPTQYLEGLHQELEEEIIEMLQKKIYGHWDIGNYRRSLKDRVA